MWDEEDPDRHESLEYVMGATAHLVAQMGDQQASLLLEDVQNLSIIDEHRGKMGPGPVDSRLGTADLHGLLP